jgi:anti-anti-sigma factor
MNNEQGSWRMVITDEMLSDGVCKINLSGRMDLEGMEQIEKTFTEMTAPPRMRIVVDLRDVSYISSIGIRGLVMSANAVSHRGGKLVLLAPQANVARVLSVTGIDRIISAYDDLETARQATSPPEQI